MTPYIKPNGDISNFWGISRDSRELGFEVSELYQFIDKSQWRQFHSLDSAEANANLVQIKRTSLIKYLPKNFVVVQSERVPWAWANYESRVTKNYTSVKVNLN